MSIWTNLIDRATGVRMRNGFRRVPITVNLEHRTTPDLQSYMEEHEIGLQVLASYRIDMARRENIVAPNEARDRARKAALEHLRRTLYGDLLRLQVEIMHAIEDADQDAARDACLRLREEILGE